MFEAMERTKQRRPRATSQPLVVAFVRPRRLATTLQVHRRPCDWFKSGHDCNVGAEESCCCALRLHPQIGAAWSRPRTTF